MESPARAADLLRIVLPREILAEIDLRSLRVDSSTLVAPEGAEQRSDVLLHVTWRDRTSCPHPLKHGWRMEVPKRSVGPCAGSSRRDSASSPLGTKSASLRPTRPSS